jgi:hypothetical protein
MYVHYIQPVSGCYLQYKIDNAIFTITFSQQFHNLDQPKM